MGALITSLASLIEAAALFLMAIFLLLHGRSLATSISRFAQTMMLVALSKDKERLSLAVRFLEQTGSTRASTEEERLES
jgi:hypothetical protein